MVSLGENALTTQKRNYGVSWRLLNESELNFYTYAVALK